MPEIKNPAKKNSSGRKEYWRSNIKAFTRFYDRISEENIDAPWPVSWLYKRFVFPVEKRYMSVRYDMVCEYINRRVSREMKVADIGCGGGIYTRMMVNRGAFVFAIDYAPEALRLTRDGLTEQEIKSVSFFELDVANTAIPESDAAIAIGVLTYTDDYMSFFNNILPRTKSLLFNFLSKRHPVNVIRRICTFLDVRKYSYLDPATVEKEIVSRGFRIVRRSPLATGIMLEVERKGI